MAEEERIEYVVDCDGTLIQTYVGGQPCVPGAEIFVAKWGPKTLLLSVGVESTQVEKLARAHLSFRNRVIVPNDDSKIERIRDIARIWSVPQKPVVLIGDRLDIDIAPARAAGLLTVRMRHPSGKYSAWEPKSPSQVPHYTVSDFYELMQLPIFC